MPSCHYQLWQKSKDESKSGKKSGLSNYNSEPIHLSIFHSSSGGFLTDLSTFNSINTSHLERFFGAQILWSDLKDRRGINLIQSYHHRQRKYLQDLIYHIILDVFNREEKLPQLNLAPKLELPVTERSKYAFGCLRSSSPIRSLQ